MNKERFMAELERYLKGMPAQEKEDALRYYREYIEDAGFSEIDDVTDKLGDPKNVARSILNECVDKRLEEQKEKGGVKRRASALWAVLLCIFAAPLAIPFIVVVFALFITVIAVFFSIEVAFLATGGSLVLAGLFLIPALFATVSQAQVIMLIGMVLILISVGTLICIAFYKLGGVFVRFIAWFFGKLIGREAK